MEPIDALARCLAAIRDYELLPSRFTEQARAEVEMYALAAIAQELHSMNVRADLENEAAAIAPRGEARGEPKKEQN